MTDKLPTDTSTHRRVNIDDYDYDLPDERIAKYPLGQRDQSKLLVYKGGQITDDHFCNLPGYIPAGSLMIFNNSKVIQARMHFRKATGAQIEIFCLEPHMPHDYALNFQQRNRCSWVCLIGNLKKWKEGGLYKTIPIGGRQISISAQRTGTLGESHIVEFAWDDNSISFADILDAVGELPIPPYLNRHTEEKDKETYQTIYSKIKGSVAAPTAGLHFTDSVLGGLKQKGIGLDEVTLHVGAGTFKPVKTSNIDEHVMHAEFISVRRELIERLLNHSGQVIAVGTTSVRTLESLYYLGEVLKENNTNPQLKVEQDMPYRQHPENRPTLKEALRCILAYLDRHNMPALVAETQIIIKPGYVYQVVDGIVTNFHQPKSTLLLLVSAFLAGNGCQGSACGDWEKIYRHALDNNYRFLSYGDSSLLLK